MWNVWEQNQAVTEQEMQPADNPQPRRSPQCECQCCAQPDFGKFYFFLYCTLLRCINNYCELAPKIKSLSSGCLASTVVHPLQYTTSYTTAPAI